MINNEFAAETVPITCCYTIDFCVEIQEIAFNIGEQLQAVMCECEVEGVL